MSSCRVLDIMKEDAQKDPAVHPEALHARRLINQVDAIAKFLALYCVELGVIFMHPLLIMTWKLISKLIQIIQLDTSSGMYKDSR